MINSTDNLLFRTLFSENLTKGEARKKEILKAIIRAIAEKGLDGTTFESVGKLAGLRKSHIAYYFPDRVTMIAAAVKYVAATAQKMTVDELSQASSPREQILAIVDGGFHWLGKHPHQGNVMLLFYFLSSVDRSYRKMHGEIRDLGAERLATILKPALKGARAENLARTIQTLIFGGMVDALTIPGLTVPLVHRRVRQAVTELLPPSLN